MARLRIGLCLASLDQPLRKALTTAARIGARGVQVNLSRDLPLRELSDTARREFRHTLSGLGLELAVLAYTTRYGFNVERGLDGRAAEIKRALAASHQLGTPILTSYIGPIAQDRDDPSRRLQTEVVSDLARHAEHVGAILTIEAGSEPPDRLRSFLEEIGAVGLQVSYDPAALVMNDFDPLAGARELHSWIVHAYARDAVRLHAEGRGQEVPLGQGEVDWPEMLGTLEELDYRGWLTLRRDHCRDPVSDLARSVQFLESF